MDPQDRPQGAPRTDASQGVRRTRAALLTAAAILLLAPLGARDLWAPDEPRYAAVAEEMRSMVHGPSGLILLHLNGAVYTQKPPLYYWLAAAAGAPLGRVTEVAARLPSALAGIGLVALTLRFGARLLGPATACLGAGLLLTAFRFAWVAQRVQLDALLSLLEMGALAAFWSLGRGGRLEPSAIRRRWRGLLALHGAMGLAVLDKGPVGFLIPTLIMAVYLGSQHRARALRAFYPPWGIALSLGPAVAWLAAAAALSPPGYLADAVGTNLFGRFFAGTSHARPFYYYLYQLPADFLPWTLLLPVAWAGLRASGNDTHTAKRREALRFLVLWVAVPCLFFTLSRGKRGLYLLPVFPAAALLTAHGVREFVRRHGRLPAWLRTLSLALGGAVALAAAALALSGPVRGVAVPRLFSLAALGAVAAGWLVGRHGPRALEHGERALLGSLVGVYLLELALFTGLAPALDAEKSPRPIALAAAALTPATEPVGLVGSRPLTGGLLYYGGRAIAPLDTPQRIRAFVDAGGRAMVVAAKRLAALQRVVPVDVRARERRGRREMLVVTPRSDAGRPDTAVPAR